jgi:hypothetical protein
MLTPPELHNDKQTIKNLLKGVIALIVIALIIWIYRQQTTGELSDKIAMLEQENSQLQTQHNALTEQHKNTTEQLLSEQQSAAVQKATNTQLLQQLNSLQDNVIELNKELSFYQNITQGNATSKLHVRELNITVDDKQSNHYHYQLVMSQGKKISKPLQGMLTLSLTGQNDQKSETIKINEHQLKLRHVQVFNGQIKLPENMEPKSIKISLIQKKKTTLSKTIDWQVTTSPTQLKR